MSAFIVNNYHIDVLVSYANTKDIRYYYDKKMNDCDNTDVIGQILLGENYKSVNKRYKEQCTAESYSYRIVIKHQNPVQILKACKCLKYQSCETDDYCESEAYAIVQAIIQTAIENIDGYEDAQWEIEEPKKVPVLERIM